MKYLSILIMFTLSGCSSQSFTDSLADQAIEGLTGKDYSRNGSQCAVVARQCSGGTYEEWKQDNGQVGCACN